MDALSRLTARRRAQPEEDFTSHLITHPARLTDDEVREHLRLVLFAAYEATVNLLANVLRMVLTDPRFRAQLNGGQMTVPEAVEQSLWDEPPFSSVFAYFAKQDTELGGQHIRRGDGLLLGIAPGNVDPRVRPDLAANMQGNRSHLAFGGGPHECPGQDIGRAIADTGVDALLMRLPDVQLDCDEDELELAAVDLLTASGGASGPLRAEAAAGREVASRATPPSRRSAATGRSAPRSPSRPLPPPRRPSRPRRPSTRSRRPRNRPAPRAPGAASWSGGAVTDRPSRRRRTRPAALACSGTGAPPP